MLKRTRGRIGNFQRGKYNRISAWHRTLLIGSLLIWMWLKFPVNADVAFNEAIVKFQNCTQKLVQIRNGTSSIPDVVSEILHELDHVFVLSFKACRTTLPETLVQKSTCVLGHKLDSYLQRTFVYGSQMHGMKVSFMHASVLEFARLVKYEHIAVIEDDAIVHLSTHSKHILHGFRRLVHSNSWSIIRFGYRPFFLEESSRQRCPPKCRCTIRKHVAEQFCELHQAGCDIRSADFYAIHSRYYSQLRSQILNTRLSVFERIVDTRPLSMLVKQWLVLPQISFQAKLDIPLDYQLGLSALYVRKCVHPRPLPSVILQQVFNSSDAIAGLRQLNL